MVYYCSSCNLIYMHNMIKYFYSLFLIAGSFSPLFAQDFDNLGRVLKRAEADSFKNIDELLQLSELDPLACEKKVTAMGYEYESTDGLTTYYEYHLGTLSYTISPRKVIYTFPNRLFSLEATSRLLKSGFTLSHTEGTLTTGGKAIKAQKYVKDKFIVWIWKWPNESEIYSIQIENSRPLDISGNASNKKNFVYKGDKKPISFSYWYLGFLKAKGELTEEADWDPPVAHPFTGTTGIGLKNGYETGIGGIAGINGLNKKLPHGLDLGIILGAQFNLHSYSLESLGEPYTSYGYDAFLKFGASIGPALTLTPVATKDFHISFFYRFDALGNTGGDFSDNYVEPENKESLSRDAPGFLLAKSYGLILHGKRVFFCTEFINYVDKGSFTWSKAYIDPNTQQVENRVVTIDANLPFSLISFKLGMVFQN